MPLALGGADTRFDIQTLQVEVIDAFININTVIFQYLI